MVFRAVAAAFAVWCMSGAATAAGYAEVWNPPEASGHVAKQAKTKAKTKTAAGKPKSAAGSKNASQSTMKHVAGASHAAPRVASASGHGSKPPAHGSVKTVAVKGATKSGAKVASVGKTSPKASMTAQSKKPHAQLVQTKVGQGKIMRANLVVPNHQPNPRTVKVAAKTGAAKPAASHVHVVTPSANVGAHPANATSSNPATASSGSLPPIIH